MKRRLNIGIGLLHRPRLLILDEPTVGVDPQSRNAILESVARLSAAGMAVLYTTHYMEEAERLCDRVGIIDLGRAQGRGHARGARRPGRPARPRALARAGDLERAAAVLRGLEGVHAASVRDDGIEVIVDGARGLMVELLGAAAVAGLAVKAVEVDEPDLEAVFLHLTGKALRE